MLVTSGGGANRNLLWKSSRLSSSASGLEQPTLQERDRVQFSTHCPRDQTLYHRHRPKAPKPHKQE
eukprot:3306916-Amphidinium_carterae.1